MAVSELAVRAAVHAWELCDCTPRPGWRAVGAEGRRRACQPWGGSTDRTCGRASRPVAGVGSRVRGIEPGCAGARGGWRTQRHAVAGRAERGPGAQRRYERTNAWRHCGTGGGGGREAHGGSCAAVPDTRRIGQARARAGCVEHGGGPARGGDRRRDRLRRARAGLRQRDRRAAAARGDPQPAGRDRPAGRARWDTLVVAPPLSRRLSGGSALRAVAHRARCRLARSCRLEHAGAACLHRLATALVCDLAASASGRLR